ncbi:hypothetical protein IFT67_18655 [Sphingomonas sp. CFBP 13728]|nr:hypothetical protein [Sphingomonas sp. CFBP 13728]MBD8620942.1 hypothetical protein [Sphingomonas sp. CFBP 13728]
MMAGSASWLPASHRAAQPVTSGLKAMILDDTAIGIVRASLAEGVD